MERVDGVNGTSFAATLAVRGLGGVLVLWSLVRALRSGLDASTALTGAAGVGLYLGGKRLLFPSPVR